MAGRRGNVNCQTASVSPYIMAFDVNPIEGGGDEIEGDVVEEGQQINVRTVGKPSSQRELDEHMITHIPYRSWCKHCISGRGQNDHHRRQLADREQDVPTVSVDYAFLGETGKETDKLQPMIVMKDRRSGTIRAHLVEEKGVNQYAIKRMGQDLALLGYKKIIMKSDNEPALVALKQAVKAERPEEIIMEESPVGESASNGEVENAIKLVEGMFRSIKSSLEERIGRKLPREHMCVPWLIRHAAETIDRYAIGSDGKTNYQRRKGNKFGGSPVEFGETIMFLRAKSVGKDKFDSRWEQGVWLGIREESGEHIIGTKEGVLKARTIRRYSEATERWKTELFDNFRGVPWKPVPGREGDQITIKASIPETRVVHQPEQLDKMNQQGGE